MKVSACVLLGLFVVSFPGLSHADGPDSEAAGASAMQLVRQALDADLAGKKEERASLLQQALRLAPLYAQARWHHGELLTEEGWLPVKEAQRLASEDRRLQQYRELRSRLDDSVAAHARLARWCRAQQWKDREQAHWYRVLSLHPLTRGNGLRRTRLHGIRI
jgi:hypothetical protein